MEAEDIIREQQELYGRIARCVENLKKLGQANITAGAVQTRLTGLERYWSTFESQHALLRHQHKDTIYKHDYMKKDYAALVEEAYYQNKGVLLDYAARLTPPPPVAGASGVPEPKPPRTTLPRIQLPQFSGKYDEWPSFSCLFTSIISRDPSMAAVEKLHYLKSCLKGEAELLIRNLNTTEENFSRAWKLLTSRYENKRLLVRSHLVQFASLQKLKSESPTELRSLCNRVRTTDSLEGLGRPIASSEDLFVHTVVELLDPRSRRDWENSISDKAEPPTYSELQRFLERRLQTLESLQPVKSEVSVVKHNASAAKQTRSLHARPLDDRRERCSVCQKDHFVMFCRLYKSKSARERKQHVESHGLCINCLGKHDLSACSSRKACSVCDARHHTSLHDAYSGRDAAKTSHVTRHSSKPLAKVLLATARVRVADRRGQPHVARALLDQGSESSLISESLAQRLNLPRRHTSLAVVGVGGRQAESARGLLDLKISSRNGESALAVTALILPRITIYEGGILADRQQWKYLDGLELADPDFLASDTIDILLGADVYAKLLLPGLLQGDLKGPIAQETRWGWILSGEVSSCNAVIRVATHQCRIDTELSDLVQQFWQQEETTHNTVPLSEDDKKCEEFFSSTFSRASDGRYIVRLPVNGPLPDFSSTRLNAIRLQTNMERRFTRDNAFQRLYVDFMQQYEKLGHMTATNATGNDEAACFLPHHGVLREASVSTKLRVVFNGSSTLQDGDSLNKHLMVGPNLLPTLSDVLMRWRRHRYVLATDIEKMYRQILVDPRDRHLQKIIWRYDRETNMREYTLNTVTYGLTCAPFLAMRTLKQLAVDEGHRFPQGTVALCQDTYMDDILTGTSSLTKAQELRKQLTELCLAGGFPLRKWSANHLSLLADIPPEHRMQSDLRAWHPQESHATLGLQWHPGVDAFSYSITVPEFRAVTKRTVLSLTARLFDPLGWLTPTLIRAKIWFQSTWLLGLDWDTPRVWTIRPRIKIRVDRHVPLNALNIELHGFADASERAYAAVVYLSSSDCNKEIQVSLIAAKSKVAPIKQVTLPRLELCAATLLVRLAAHVKLTLQLNVRVHLWSDSTVALGWIRGHPSRWKTYIANQVSEIQTTLPGALWHHISGEENPADCASRGLSPSELTSHPLWWQGPPWLRHPQADWPIAVNFPDEQELPEQRSSTHVSDAVPVADTEPPELTRFSSLHRLLRVTSWCRRWLLRRTLVRPRVTEDSQTAIKGVLALSELDDARVTWIRVVQARSYHTELKLIQLGKTLPTRHSLTKLTPFLDEHGILRVGGRIKHALLAYDERHPIILPPASHLAKLIVQSCHSRTLHGGVQLTLAAVRQQYWIPRGRSLVKSLIHRCVICVRWRAVTPQQVMGDLPRYRVKPERPFLRTGVDYAGPIMLRTTKGRGYRAIKAFIAIFVCMVTRAVHLEAVSDYTTEAFLASLRRFTSRRGLCRSLHSDCGTNFVGADAQLRAFFSARNPDQRRTSEQLAKDQIQWKFNPPAAPHFGGLWEAAVKAVKHHLRRVIGEATLTYEEMSTLLAQVEACLNSRPLHALTDDPEDLTALTPGHFLVGSALNAVPEVSYTDTPVNRLTRWQLVQQMRDHFWERWSREYLHVLLQRSKWWSSGEDLCVGRLCLVKNELSPPARWPLARITEVHPGEDGKIRVVTVRTATSSLTRPITKIILLPTGDVEFPDQQSS